MTFEEFFLKKKIDLDFFEQGKPDVFAEFVAHYEVMNEKSFDHTKKYWFNNLRIEFPLSEEKELQLKEAFKPRIETVPVSETIEATAVESSTTIKAPAFKSRFKALITSAVKPIEDEVIKSTEAEGLAETPKPDGFKPRFKASLTAPAPEILEEKIDPVREEQPEEKKPVLPKPAGFKPRFKALKKED